jgi:hypothetical protein
MRDMTPWPTVAAYLDWARGAGCTVRIVERAPYRCAIMVNGQTGAQATEVFLEESDRVMSTNVARLDRRLGIKSHFFL